MAFSITELTSRRAYFSVKLAFPDTDAKIEVSLGFTGQQLAFMGVYAVDGVSGGGQVQTMRITATAADLKGEIRAPKTRGWEQKSLKDIVATIAGESGLTPVVGDSVAGKVWDYLAQTAESNLHFLSRIAAQLDATAKPAGGALVVQARGEGKTAAGDTLTPPEIPRHRFSNWSWSYEGRAVYRAAEAEWTDTRTGVTHKFKVGSGTPLKKIRLPRSVCGWHVLHGPCCLDRHTCQHPARRGCFLRSAGDRHDDCSHQRHHAADAVHDSMMRAA